MATPKEAQEVKSPKAPDTAADLSNFKRKVRSIVKAASAVPKLAFDFTRRVEAKTKDDAEERALEIELNVPPPQLETLDAKVGAAVFHS